MTYYYDKDRSAEDTKNTEGANGPSAAQAGPEILFVSSHAIESHAIVIHSSKNSWYSAEHLVPTRQKEMSKFDGSSCDLRHANC